jgi:hypothetical protein
MDEVMWTLAPGLHGANCLGTGSPAQTSVMVPNPRLFFLVRRSGAFAAESSSSVRKVEMEERMERDDPGQQAQASNEEVPRIHPNEPAEGAEHPGEDADQPRPPHTEEPAEGAR